MAEPGAFLASGKFWGSPPISENPLVEHLMRRADMKWLRLVCCAPWCIVGVVGSIFLWYAVTLPSASVWGRWCVISLPLNILVGCFTGIFSVLIHIHHLGSRLQLEELLLTRLKPRELVQGIGFPPFAAQMSGWLLGATIQTSLLVAFGVHRMKFGWTPVECYALPIANLALAMQVPQLVGMATLRAALYLDSPGKAALWALRDAIFSRAGFGLGAVLFIALPLCVVTPFYGILIILYGVFRSAEVADFAQEAVAEAGNYPRHWAFAGARALPTDFPFARTWSAYFAHLRALR